MEIIPNSADNEQNNNTIDVSTLRHILFQNISKRDDFINVENKEFGIIPYYNNGRYHQQDDDKSILKNKVSEELEKLLKSDLKKSFDENLQKKLKNSINFPEKLVENVIKNHMTLFKILDESEINKKPYELNVLNGVLDLRTLLLRERKNNDFFFYCARGRFIQEYKDEPIEFTDLPKKVVSTGYQHDFNFHNGGIPRDYTDKSNESDERFESLMCIYGYLLTGETMEKKLFIECGDSNTGKSTRHRLLIHILGGYATTCAVSTIVRSVRTKSDIRPELVKLRNNRIIFTAEPSRNDVFDEKLLKTISGGDTLNFRKPHSSNIVEFIPKGTMVLSTNDIPKIEPLDDDAFFKRIVTIVTAHKNTETNFDQHYFEKMTEQHMMDKVLTYLCRYAKKYYDNNHLYIHQSFVKDKIQFYLNQSDPVSIFFKSCICPPNFTGEKCPKIMITYLYQCFLDFCSRNNIEHKLTRRVFSKRFQTISEPLGIVKHDHDQKHGTYYDQFFVNISRKPVM